MHIFHKWGKWEEYSQNFTISPGLLMPKDTPIMHTVEQWQKRTCSVCGYTQREEIRTS